MFPVIARVHNAGIARVPGVVWCCRVCVSTVRHVWRGRGFNCFAPRSPLNERSGVRVHGTAYRVGAHGSSRSTGNAAQAKSNPIHTHTWRTLDAPTPPSISPAFQSRTGATKQCHVTVGDPTRWAEEHHNESLRATAELCIKCEPVTNSACVHVN